MTDQVECGQTSPVPRMCVRRCARRTLGADDTFGGGTLVRCGGKRATVADQLTSVTTSTLSALQRGRALFSSLYSLSSSISRLLACGVFSRA